MRRRNWGLDFATMVNAGLSCMVTSELSARTAAAHTGAMVGDDRPINAVFADLGGIRADSIEDMLITAGAASALGRLERPGIGVMSRDPSVGVVGVINGVPWVSDGKPYLAQMFVDAIGAGMAEAALPHGVRQPGRAAGHRLHPSTADDAVKAAAEFRGPVCVKIVSPQVMHKTKIGGALLDVPPAEDAVGAAFAAVTTATTAAPAAPATVEGVLVTPMRRGTSSFSPE